MYCSLELNGTGSSFASASTREVRTCGWKMRSFALTFLLAAAAAVGCIAWGDDGHEIVCEIAESMLSTAARSAVNKLLPDYANGSLASLCSWADYYRHEKGHGWSTPLHFMDSPDGACSVTRADCQFRGHPGICVTSAILNYTDQLQRKHEESVAHPLQLRVTYNKTEALLFLAHFMGDIHQPLHCGHISDRGGNSLIVTWFGKKSDEWGLLNLHSVWDTYIIESAIKKYISRSNLVRRLKRRLENVHWYERLLWDWSHCRDGPLPCPLDYANESVKDACEKAYPGISKDSVTDLGHEYFLETLPVVEVRLAAAGYRLGSLLNQLFDPTANVKVSTV